MLLAPFGCRHDVFGQDVQAPAKPGACDNAGTRGECQNVDIPNFGKVADGIWRGAAPSASGLKELAADGVRTVVDLRLGSADPKREEILAEHLGIKYIHLPMGYCEPSRSKIKAFLKIVSNPLYQPVYIHCREGADRTGTLVGIYRILVQGWPFQKAYREMRSHHFKPWLLPLKKTVKTCKQQMDA